MNLMQKIIGRQRFIFKMCLLPYVGSEWRTYGILAVYRLPFAWFKLTFVMRDFWLHPTSIERWFELQSYGMPVRCDRNRAEELLGS